MRVWQRVDPLPGSVALRLELSNTSIRVYTIACMGDQMFGTGYLEDWGIVYWLRPGEMQLGRWNNCVMVQHFGTDGRSNLPWL